LNVDRSVSILFSVMTLPLLTSFEVLDDAHEDRKPGSPAITAAAVSVHTSRNDRLVRFATRIPILFPPGHQHDTGVTSSANDFVARGVAGTDAETGLAWLLARAGRLQCVDHAHRMFKHHRSCRLTDLPPSGLCLEARPSRTDVESLKDSGDGATLRLIDDGGTGR
jgi:hypothetical protein